MAPGASSSVPLGPNPRLVKEQTIPLEDERDGGVLQRVEHLGRPLTQMLPSDNPSHRHGNRVSATGAPGGIRRYRSTGSGAERMYASPLASGEARRGNSLS